MKKWIAMLLAVMMLVLPLAGLAEAPEELMDKALDDGLTLETTVSFSAGNLPFGEEINTPVADLLNALSFYHLENENDQSVFAVRLSGEDALRVETQLDVDDRDYFKFNWLGDSVLSFNESELETTMKRIVEGFRRRPWAWTRRACKACCRALSIRTWTWTMRWIWTIWMHSP